MQSLRADQTNTENVAGGKWFGLFSAQAGVVMFSSMGWALMLTVTLVNLGAEENSEALDHRNTYYAILYCYTVPMLVSFSLLYVGANKPDAILLMIGLAVQCAFGVYWITISAMSWIDEPQYTYSVCIDNRCPETLWLYSTQWRTFGNECVVYIDDLLVASAEGTTARHPKRTSNASRPIMKRIMNPEEPVTSTLTLPTRQFMNKKVHENLTYDGTKVLWYYSGSRSLNYSDHPMDLQNDSNVLDEVSTRTKDIQLISGNHEDLSDVGSALLAEQNQTVGTTRVIRLAERPEDIKIFIQDLLRLLSKKPFANLSGAERLKMIISYGSRVLGCTENVDNSKIKSGIGAFLWFAFLVYGNLGTLMYTIHLRKMEASGEL